MRKIKIFLLIVAILLFVVSALQIIRAIRMTQNRNSLLGTAIVDILIGFFCLENNVINIKVTLIRQPWRFSIFSLMMILIGLFVFGGEVWNLYKEVNKLEEEDDNITTNNNLLSKLNYFSGGRNNEKY